MSQQNINGKLFDANFSLSGCVLDSTNTYVIHPDSLAQTLTYNGPGGTVDSVTVGPDARGFYYKQTMTYTGANPTGFSAWVKQP